MIANKLQMWTRKQNLRKFRLRKSLAHNFLFFYGTRIIYMDDFRFLYKNIHYLTLSEHKLDLNSSEILLKSRTPFYRVTHTTFLVILLVDSPKRVYLLWIICWINLIDYIYALYINLVNLRINVTCYVIDFIFVCDSVINKLCNHTMFLDTLWLEWVWNYELITSYYELEAK